MLSFADRKRLRESATETISADTCRSMIAARDDVEAALLALPTIVVTPLVVMLCQTVGFLPRIAGFGSVVMPLPVTATDLRLEDFTNSRGGRLRLGSTLHMRLLLGRRFNARSAEELEATLGILMGTLRIDVTFEARGCQPQPLVVTLTPNAALHCVIATVSVPMTLGSGFAVNVHAVSMAGSIVDGLSACVPVQGSGVITPLVLRSFSCFHPSTPCISLDGHVYCPPGNNPVQEVLVYDSDGTPQHGLATSDLGLLGMTCWTAHVHSDSPSLLLADYDGNVVAVDPAARTIRWKSKISNSCFGIVPLPFHGVVIVGDVTSLYALRLSDGSSVGCLAVPDLAWFLAADPLGSCMGQSRATGCFTSNPGPAPLMAWESRLHRVPSVQSQGQKVAALSP